MTNRYDEGYRDGENSATADWLMGLWDGLLEHEGIAYEEMSLTRVKVWIRNRIAPNRHDEGATE